MHKQEDIWGPFLSQWSIEASAVSLLICSSDQTRYRAPNQVWQYSRSLEVYVGLGRSRFEFTFLSEILFSPLPSLKFLHSFQYSVCRIHVMSSSKWVTHNSIVAFHFINKTEKNLSLTKGNPTVQLVSSYIKQLMRMRKLENYVNLKITEWQILSSFFFLHVYYGISWKTVTWTYFITLLFYISCTNAW